jgi:hypothetical protein
VIKRATNVTVLLLVLAGLVACDHSRKDTIHATIIAVNAARDGFIEWDRTRQEQIVAAATSKEEGRAKLDAYREGRTKIYDGIALAYKLLIDALTDDGDSSLKSAVREATKLVTDIKTFKDAP